MILSAKSLKRLFKGALTFEVERGYLTAYRYSEAQLEFMAKEDYDWGWRMRGKFTGCVRIELETDAKHISFSYKASHTHIRSNTIDLFVNGALSAIHRIGENLTGRVEFSMPEGKKLVSIYMPCESTLQIRRFTIDGKYKSVRPKGKKLLIIGDSITQGAGPDFSSGAYANVLQRKTGYDVLAQGIGGYRFEPRDLMRVDGFEPDKILVFLGTNYYDVLSYDYEGDSIKFFDILTTLYPETPIYAVSPLWRSDDIDWERFSWCIDKVKSACARHKEITLINGFDIMPNVNECLSDGVHPNAYASELIADNLTKILKKNYKL